MKQFAIIGLGNFGYYLATRLYDKGHEVLAIDRDPNRVQEIRDKVSQAVVADATDRKAVEPLGIKQMDAAIICIGSVLSDSILATLNLKEIGVEKVFAKAITEAHGRILQKIGVSEIFFPEKDMALSLAERLENPNMIDYLPFLEDYSIVELAPPKEFIGKALKDLDLINRYGVQVVAIKEIVPDKLNLIPTAQFVLKDSDIMILLGPNDSLAKLKELGS
ncbi:MAG: TrkA family potassium uptake protein [Deltaproteobacteria bacterium]|nr:TrkA family potassium uptake protein [Deltaproteobacteria bacterium]MBW1935464.1 TrkA family potassium uptake protein [Deltaproteobacteria bacterium]MBW1978615.1 TrkA family potassium uptake protein [Deltaproteobacteria bacterium]MBW2045993.1 TrkA family potassium uptake protein [Deltaproteobacteria bacterium]MBW2301177.1 TrkA family potassium uptake protein [Deltaproteobacteria bacterium]